MKIKLNKQQEELANFRKGYCIALASAGSGKSFTILERTRRMVTEGISPSTIMILTFSKKSVSDLQKKMTKEISKVRVVNFHGLCYQTLKAHGNNKSLVVGWQLDNYFSEKHGADFPLGELISWISFQKSHMNRPTAKVFAYKELENISADKLPKLYKEYEKFNKDNNFLDFDDMLLDFVDLLKSNVSIQEQFAQKYEYIMVDEHQDSSRVQNEMLKLITGAGNLVCIGDIKQNIYNFRGSDLSICLDFKKDWKNATVIQLPTNYRSTVDIVNISNDFIRPSFANDSLYADAQAHNQTLGQIKVGNQSDGVVDKIKLLVDKGVEYKDIAVLYRTNFVGGAYEIQLREMGIPCTVVEDKPFLERFEIDVIMSYLKLSVDNTDYQSFTSVINKPNRFLGKVFLGNVAKASGKGKTDLLDLRMTMKPYELKNYKEFVRTVGSIDPNGNPNTQIDYMLKKAGLIEYIKHNYDDAEDKIKSIKVLQKIAGKYKTVKQFLFMILKPVDKSNLNAVQLMTVHKSKGLEFDHTFVVNVDEGLFPHYRAVEEEERRLFYVAISRAVKGLYVYGDSDFVTELEEIIKKGEYDNGCIAEEVFEAKNITSEVFDIEDFEVGSTYDVEFFDESVINEGINKKLDTLKMEIIQGLQDDLKW